MLMPKRVKFRKQFRGSMAGKAMRGNQITHGAYGLVATEPCWLKSNQIEAARVALTRYIKRGGNFCREEAKEALRLAMHKLPCKCRIASKEEVNGAVNAAQTAEGGEQSEN